MNSAQRKGVALSLLIVAIGVCWLLNVYAVIPGVNWIWTGGLAVAGVLVFALSALNQLTVIVGPFLILGSVLSILRQTGHPRIDLEVPILVIVFGILLLLSYVLRLPPPAYLQGSNSREKE
jgi:hypothetical protein